MSKVALRRNMGLELPISYVEIENDEMEYIDGGGIGKHKYNKTSAVGLGLDVVITAATGGLAVFSQKAAQKLIKQHRGTITRVVKKQIQKHIGNAYAGAVGTAIDIGLTVGGTSIGGMIAEGLDRADGKNDNYVFA